MAVGITLLVLAGAAAGAVFLTAGDDDATAPALTTLAAATSTSAPTTAATSTTTTVPDPVRPFADLGSRAGTDRLAAIARADDGTFWVTDYREGEVLHVDAHGALLDDPSRKLDATAPSTPQAARVVTRGADVWVVSNGLGLYVRHGDADWQRIDDVEHPHGLALAVGGGVWVTDYGANDAATDGIDDRLLLRFYDDGRPPTAELVGSNPYSVADDGIDVFVARAIEGTVHRASRGPQDPGSDRHVGGSPWDVLPTPDAVWVSNRGTQASRNAPFLGGSVQWIDRARFDTAEPKVVAVGDDARYLWEQADGRAVWVSVYGSDRVVRFAPDGAVTGVFCFPDGSHPNGITGDGAALYVVTEHDGQIRTIPLDAPQPSGCALPAPPSTTGTT